MPFVLIIDDEPFELSALGDALGDDDYQVGTAGSGAEAKACLEEYGDAVDAVILDWVLPDIDGIELLRWIKGQPEYGDIEVVIESAEIIPEKIQAGIDCGAFYYLTKPYEDAQLRAIVKSAISTRQLKRSIVDEVEEASDALRMLESGTFLVRTTDEAQTLAVRLASACQAPDQGVALFELLVNAIEHGNLGITYDDKTELLANQAHQQEVCRRLELPEHRDKRVVVQLDRNDDLMRLSIRDCGEGFDYRQYLTVDPQRLFDSHGRGILLAGSAFDLEYVDPGNEVLVTMGAARDGEEPR